MMWCLKHENYKIVYTDPDTEFHIDWIGEDLCDGPFYNSAPPEKLPDEMQYQLEDEYEPDAEELEVMDQNAELLLFDLGLMEK